MYSSHITIVFISVESPIHCLQGRFALKLSLKPPTAALAGLSADTTAMVP